MIRSNFCEDLLGNTLSLYSVKTVLLKHKIVTVNLVKAEIKGITIQLFQREKKR